MIQDALVIPDERAHGRIVSLVKCISAVQLVPKEDGRGAKLGLFSQLPAGIILEICGDGFTDRTVKVRANDLYYFVFKEDLEIAQAAGA